MSDEQPLRDVFLRPINDIDQTAQTTDATANVVIATVKPTPGTVTRVDAKTIAQKQGGGDGAGWNTVATFITDASGVCTMLGHIVSAFQHTAGAGAWGADIDTDGAVIRFKATGAASTVIDWHVVGGSDEAPGATP